MANLDILLAEHPCSMGFRVSRRTEVFFGNSESTSESFTLRLHAGL